MMNFIKFLMKRPSDKAILRGRMIFALLYMGILGYNLIYLGKPLEASFINDTNEIAVKGGLIALGLIPLFMGITNFCVLHKKYMRIAQILFGFILFYISGFAPDSPDLEYNTVIFLMGFAPLLAGLTGKCITQKCLKHKEKIIKIRV